MGTTEGGRVVTPPSMEAVMLPGQWVCFSNFSLFIARVHGTNSTERFFQIHFPDSLVGSKCESRH